MSAFRSIIIPIEHIDMACAIAQAVCPAESYFDAQVVNAEDGPVFGRMLSGEIGDDLAAAFDSVSGALAVVAANSLPYTESQVESMLLRDGNYAPGELVNGAMNGAVISSDADVWGAVLDPRGWWVL